MFCKKQRPFYCFEKPSSHCEFSRTVNQSNLTFSKHAFARKNISKICRNTLKTCKISPTFARSTSTAVMFGHVERESQIIWGLEVRNFSREFLSIWTMETRYKENNLLWPYFTKHEMKFCQVLSYKTSR